MSTTSSSSSSHAFITFVGGGNMASAIIGGLIQKGHPTTALQVIEPWAEQRARLVELFPGLQVHEAAGSALQASDLVVWAVKPQTFKEAATAARPHLGDALHLSVAAGITSDSMVAWLGTERIVRAMPNTPALVALGMTGLFARSVASDVDRLLVETVVKTTGDFVWVENEKQLDAVTAISGSGPAYVFYFLEAMRDAGAEMGLPPELAQRLAMGTFAGATALAQQATDPLQLLRERVTSKGGTTYAALASMEANQIKVHFQKAMLAAQKRAEELGAEFGG